MVVSPSGSVSKYALKFDFKASNNIAEYEALVAGLQLTRELGADDLRIFSDSQLVVNQISGDFQTKEHQLAAYLGYVKILLQSFRSTNLTLIPVQKIPRQMLWLASPLPPQTTSRDDQR